MFLHGHGSYSYFLENNDVASYIIIIY